MNYRSASLSPIMMMMLTSPAAADTYVVNPDGTGDFPTIQSAIIGAESGDVIELTDGTYTGEGNRDIHYAGRDIWIRSQSGNPEACIIDLGGSGGAQRKAIYFQSGVGPGAALEGITIANGWNEDLGSGAIQIYDRASPTIINCRFIDNHGSGPGAVEARNGAPTFTDCVFRNNSPSGLGTYGGAVSVSSSDGVVFTRCRFESNSAGSGGGVICSNDADATLIDCLFIDNDAERGGGVYCFGDAIVGIQNCTFAKNRAIFNGGGIFVKNNASVTATNTIITSSESGGSVSCEDDGSITLTCSNLWGNEGGDWVGCIARQFFTANNMSADPCFCRRSYHIAETSPCAPRNNRCDVRIGALDVGCGDCGGEVPIHETTWGQLKAGYR